MNTIKICSVCGKENKNPKQYCKFCKSYFDAPGKKHKKNYLQEYIVMSLLYWVMIFISFSKANYFDFSLLKKPLLSFIMLSVGFLFYITITKNKK